MSDSVLEAPTRPELANYVGGEWAPARSGRTYQKHNPANPGELVGEFPSSGEEDVAAAVEAYRSAFPQRKFALQVPPEPLMLEGAPDLIVQLLDKLIDNAVDFSPPASTIRVRLERDAQAARLEIENAGATLAPENRARIFESLWRSRTEGDGRPHFGLGLYIVRLIAEFHGGEAYAENLPDATGVRFAIRLPLQSRR